MRKLIDHVYIAVTIAFTVYGLLIMKWRIAKIGKLPDDVFEKIKLLLLLVVDPYIFSGFLAAFLASMAWMVAMTKFELSYAYPFTSLNFVVVLLLSGWILHEPLGIQKYIGIFFIVLGTTVAAFNLLCRSISAFRFSCCGRCS